MNKQYESNNSKSDNPFNINLCKRNGELEKYHLLKGEERHEITLRDLVDEQISSMESESVTRGYFTQNASNEHKGRNASSGDFTRNASSGHFAKNASSGDCTQNASSGDRTKNASSGDCAQNASSGDRTQNASSGHFAKNVVTGKNSVVFDCGFESVAKAANGTWISLCEYRRNKNYEPVPFFAASAQIGNAEYTDYQGKVMSEDEYYILDEKKFTAVILYGEVKLIKQKTRNENGVEIIECITLKKGEIVYCVRRNNLSAFGETLEDAMSDLALKEEIKS